MFDMTSKTSESVLLSERIEFRQGTLTFEDGEMLIPIAIKVFKKMYHEPSPPPKYEIKLSSPRLGAQIGPEDKALITYFDD